MSERTAQLEAANAKLLKEIISRLKAEKERAHFFNLSLGIMGIAATKGYFNSVNRALTETLGWSAQDLTARPFLDLIHPDDQAATLREVEKLAAGQPTLHFENRYRL